MNRITQAAFKAVLFAYPAQFRRDYSDALVQLLADRHRHGGARLAPLVLSEVVDAIRVAPRMRWESPMNRLVLVAIGVAVAAAVALSVGPLALIPIAVAALAAALWWLRQGRPIVPVSSSHRGLVWLAMGVAGVGVAVLIPAVDGGELNEFWWTVAAISLLGGIAMTATGFIHAVNNRGPRPTTIR